MEAQKGENPPESTKIIKCKFILFGISSLLAWNAIMTELDFFNAFLGKLSPYKTVSFLNFFPNIILQFVLLWKKNLFKITNQLIFALIASIILLIVIPISVYIFNNNENLDIGITVVLFLIMGLVNALMSSGFFAFTSQFPLEMIISLSTGQGFAGIILNIIKYIILPTVPIDDDLSDEDKEKKETIRGVIFFSISAVILLSCLICFTLSLKTEYFYYYLNRAKSSRISRLLDDEEEKTYQNNDELEGLSDINQQNIENISFCGMFKLLYDINLLCVFIYVVTFTLYPVSIQHQYIFDLDFDYNLNTILTIYNCFDTIGRYLVSKVTPTKKLAYISSLIRGIFLVTFILNYYFQSNDANETFTSLFLIINVTLFALTNGIGTTLCFGIAPTLVNDELKGQAGASVSFFTIVGIFVGACLAFATDEILKAIHDYNDE